MNNCCYNFRIVYVIATSNIRVARCCCCCWCGVFDGAHCLKLRTKAIDIERVSIQIALNRINCSLAVCLAFTICCKSPINNDTIKCITMFRMPLKLNHAVDVWCNWILCFALSDSFNSDHSWSLCSCHCNSFFRT